MGIQKKGKKGPVMETALGFSLADIPLEMKRDLIIVAFHEVLQLFGGKDF